MLTFPPNWRSFTWLIDYILSRAAVQILRLCYNYRQVEYLIDRKEDPGSTPGCTNTFSVCEFLMLFSLLYSSICFLVLISSVSLFLHYLSFCVFLVSRICLSFSSCLTFSSFTYNPSPYILLFLATPFLIFSFLQSFHLICFISFGVCLFLVFSSI